MPKIALNIIVKNESHIINRMLESVRPVIDLIVAVDTGSTDNTIVLIKEFGQKYQLPTFVFERPFDNFCNSRNYAMDMLLKVAEQLKLATEQVWGLIIDCDDTLMISPQFQKDQLCKDLYHLIVRQGSLTYRRNGLFRLSGQLRWESPVHEFLVSKKSSATVANFDNLYINEEYNGASWKGDLEKKYLNYAQLLTEYLEEGHEDYRTLFYTGSSYQMAATKSKSKTRSREHCLAANKYFEMAFAIKKLAVDEKIALSSLLAKNKCLLGEEWQEQKCLLLNAYCIDPKRGESIAIILSYYISMKQWNIAYLFSYFGDKMYSGNKPTGNIIGITDTSLYQWTFLHLHTICTYMSGKPKEAKLLRTKLRAYLLTHRSTLSLDDVFQIQSSTLIQLSLRYRKMKIGRFFRIG